MSLTLPQVPKDADAVKILKWAQDLVRALHGQLTPGEQIAGHGDIPGPTQIPEHLGLTVKPQIVAQCYDITARFNVNGYPTERNGLLEYFNPGNAGVVYVTTVALDTIDRTTSPFSQTNKFAVEFRGTFHAGSAGNYFFGLDADGVAELLVDGKVVARKYVASTRAGAFGGVGAAILTVGYHALVVRWVEGTPGASPGIRIGTQKPADSSMATIVAADLGHYTGGLEAGVPSNNPSPQAPTTVATDTTSYTVHLPWTYTQPAAGGSAKQAEGFIVYHEDGTTGNPAANQVKVGVTNLAYDAVIPKGITRSFAIASFRKTENGEEVGAKQTVASWQGIVNNSPANITTSGGGGSGALPSVEVKQGGAVNVTGTGLVVISGAQIQILSNGLILVQGGKIVLQSGQPIQVQSMQATPATIDFTDSAGVLEAQISGRFIGPVPIFQLYPATDRTGQIRIGDLAARWLIVQITGSVQIYNAAGVPNPGGSNGTFTFDGQGPANFFQLKNMTAIQTDSYVASAAAPGATVGYITVQDLLGNPLGRIYIQA